MIRSFKFPALAVFGLLTIGLLGMGTFFMPSSFAAPIQAGGSGGGGAAAPPTYTTTGTSYVTLQTTNGCETFCQFAVGVGGGTGGGAVTSATCCGKDVSKCVKGTVSGTSGAVLVNVSSKECEKAMRCGGKITITLANGNTFTIDVPGFLVSIEVDTFGLHEFPATTVTFVVRSVQAVTDPAMIPSPTGGTAGTISSLPYVASIPYDTDSDAYVNVVTTGVGPFATLAGTNGQLKGPIALSRGIGFLSLDLSQCSHGALVMIEFTAPGMDKSITSITVK